MGDVRICLGLKSFHWVPPELSEMYCVRPPQQWSPEQAQRAGAPAPRLSGPRLAFRLSPPHFSIPSFYSTDVRCGECPHYSILCHFVDALDTRD